MNRFLKNRSRLFILLSQVALLFFVIALLPTAASAVFCSQCGEKAPEGSEFCPGCGAALAVPDAMQPESAEQKKPVSADTPTVRFTVKLRYAIPPSLGWTGKKRFLVYLDSKLVYEQTMMVSDRPGDRGKTKFTFPACEVGTDQLCPGGESPVGAGIITWVAEIKDNEPDRDVARAYTRVVFGDDDKEKGNKR